MWCFSVFRVILEREEVAAIQWSWQVGRYHARKHLAHIYEILPPPPNRFHILYVFYDGILG